MKAQELQLDQTSNVVVASFGCPQIDSRLMQEAVDELLARMRYDNAVYFILDLQQVEFLSSACLGMLVQFLQEIEAVRGRVALANCMPNVAFLFKVTRLDSVFTLYDDLGEARAQIVRG